MRKILIGLGIALGIVVLVLISRLNTAGGTEVEVAEVERQTIRSSILASGQIAYREEVELRPEVMGQVIEVRVEEGDRVHKGDVILRLDPETIRAEVEQQRASVRQQEIAIERQKLTIENLERQWQRQQQLFEQGLIDASSFDNATNELEIARLNLQSQQQALSQARALLAQAEERLNKTVIRAPIDGMVTGVFVEVGETVISGTTNIAGSNLLSIADPSAILAKVQVDEADIANVQLGQEATVYAAAYPDKPMEGSVRSIATTARTAQGRQGLSFEVEILLREQAVDLTLRPGMSARAEIYTQTAEDVPAVPLQAVLYPEERDARSPPAGSNGTPDEAGARPYVFLVKDGRAVKREVETGISNDSLQQIRSGLEVGERIIVGPVASLRHLEDGAAVTVKESGNKSAGGGG